jgi:hypothetical protein
MYENSTIAMTDNLDSSTGPGYTHHSGPEGPILQRFSCPPLPEDRVTGALPEIDHGETEDEQSL